MLKVRCHRCGYNWFTKSKKKYVCCSNCQCKTLKDKKRGKK